MSADDAVQRIGEFMGRRRFLSQVGAATLTAAFVVLGRPERAAAEITVACCHLCHSPGSTGCDARPVVCTWSWTCCYMSGARVTRYRCIECYCNTGSDCDSDCTGVTSSRIVNLGDC